MSAKTIAVHREGVTLFITTEDEDDQRVHQFPAEAPVMERPEGEEPLPPNYPSEEAEVRGEPFVHDQASWVKTCAREAELAHDHLAAQAREPEREDLTHLLG